MSDNNSSKELLLSSLNSFYNNNNIYKLTLKNIIDGKHELSLRMIDWLVTRYAKTNNIIYWINDTDQDIYDNLPENHNNEKYKKITLYLDYRAQLKSFNTKIITYALENQKKIYENMSKFSYKKQIKISNKNSLVPKQDIINTKCYVVFD